MFRTNIHAPTFSKLRAANSSSTPVLPPSPPCIARNVFVSNAHPCTCIPPAPIGFSKLCSTPAPNPSVEIPNAFTRNRVTFPPWKHHHYHPPDNAHLANRPAHGHTLVCSRLLDRFSDPSQTHLQQSAFISRAKFNEELLNQSCASANSQKPPGSPSRPFVSTSVAAYCALRSGPRPATGSTPHPTSRACDSSSGASPWDSR